MSVVGVHGDYVVNTAPSWLFAGTKLHQGDILDLAIGNEADAQEPPTGHSPANLQVVLHGVALTANSSRPHLITAAYYSAPSGGGVFATGTIWWICALDATCSIAANGPFVRGVTVNVLRVFANGPAGWVHPSRGNLDEVLRGTTKSKT